MDQEQRRLEFQALLEEILGSDQVYFQSPNNVAMQYPAILYVMDDADSKFADNTPYSFTHRYQVTLIHSDPDTAIRTQIAMLPMCLFNRHYRAENLNHYVFHIFF